MSDLLKKIQSVSTPKTYDIGLLQAKAYRILKQSTARALKKEEISTIEWAFLGLLYENKEGLHGVTAAKELGVEAPFISVLIKKFEERKFIKVLSDKADNRAKIFSLTAPARAFVEKTESSLREQMRPLLNGASTKDVLGYITVLETIIKNSTL